MQVVTRELDLGWNVTGPLNMLLLQPLYGVETARSCVGTIKDEFRAGQTAIVQAVVELIKDSDHHLPGPYRPLHAIVLPELAVPQEAVTDLLSAIALAPRGTLVVAGMERLQRDDYRALVNDEATDGELRTHDMAHLQAERAPGRDWVNAMLIAWRDHNDQKGVIFQRKLVPSAVELDSLCTGDTLHLLQINDATFAFAICSDLLAVSGPGNSAVGEFVECIIGHFGTDMMPRTLDGLFHIQYNPDPDHNLIHSSVAELVVRSPLRVGEAIRGAMIIRVNRAAACEFENEFGRTGVMVGNHRRYAHDAPTCCHRIGEGEVVRYNLRPQRASAFLLRTQLPSRAPGTHGAVGIQPVEEGLWIGLRPGGSELDFSGEAAAVPEPYRFAAWRAFPEGLEDSMGTGLLKPPDDNPEQQELLALLERAYAELRRRCWAVNGECLGRWGREVFAFVAPHGECEPDAWNCAHENGLRRLVAGLTMIHASRPLCPTDAADHAVRAALQFEGSDECIHSRDACGRTWDDIIRNVIASDVQNTNTLAGDVYVVSNARGVPSLESIQIGGLVTSDAPTYDIPTPADEMDVARATVRLIPVSAIEQRILCLGHASTTDLRRSIDSMLSGTC